MPTGNRAVFRLRLRFPWLSWPPFTLPGLQGLYTADSALRELLKGTGLNCTFENADNAIRLGFSTPTPLM